jgi:hypothetical protein
MKYRCGQGAENGGAGGVASRFRIKLLAQPAEIFLAYDLPPAASTREQRVSEGSTNRDNPAPSVNDRLSAQRISSSSAPRHAIC